MRGGGIVIAVIVGIVLGFRGIFRLIKMKKYIRFTVYSLFWFGFPFGAIHLFSNMDKIEQHAKIWVVIPLIFICLFWIFFGFVINKKVENMQSGIDYKDKKSKQRRIIGLILTIITIIIWFIGINHYYDVSDTIEFIGSTITSIIFMFGFLYLITGKPFDMMDD